MSSPSEVARYRRLQSDLVVLARRDLARAWKRIDHSDRDAARAALQAVYPDIVQAYGSSASSIAAQRYDDLRAAAPVKGPYRARVAPVVTADHAKAVARWALAVSPEDAERVLSLLAGATQRLVQQPGRDTIGLNTRRDPAKPRWARVPSGPAPCAWCLMLSSRGAVYWTEKSAGGKWDGDAYHNDCECEPEPVWGDDIPSYDYKLLEKQYIEARDAAGTGQTADITKQLRADLGLHH